MVGARKLKENFKSGAKEQVHPDMGSHESKTEGAGRRVKTER